MIISFRCKHTEQLHYRNEVKKFISISEQARKKLFMLNTTIRLEDLRMPPSNHSEASKGNRKGQYSIRINKQWQLYFSWYDGNAYNVEIVDYH